MGATIARGGGRLNPRRGLDASGRLRYRRGRVTWVDEVWAAIGTGTAWRRAASGLALPVRVAGLAYLPLIGGLVGVVAAAAGATGALLTPLAGVVAAVAMLELLAGRRPTPTGGVTAAVKGLALFAVPGGQAWLVALALAAGLGRWAVVVQCYGGRPASGPDASPLVGRARFREFGVASLSAIGGALVALDALGLLAVLASAATTVALRALAYRRGPGLTQARLERTESVVEAVVLVVLAAVVVTVQPARN